MRPKTDFLFTLVLFCVFAVSALGLVITGVNVYGRTVSSMEQNYTSRTALSYVAEKIRQNDTAGSVKTADNILCLSQISENEEYVLYIYEHEGFLMELLTRPELPFDPDAGQEILEVSGFSVSEKSDGLLEISAEEKQEGTVSLYLHLKSSGT